MVLLFCYRRHGGDSGHNLSFALGTGKVLLHGELISILHLLDRFLVGTRRIVSKMTQLTAGALVWGRSSLHLAYFFCVIWVFGREVTLVQNWLGPLNTSKLGDIPTSRPPRFTSFLSRHLVSNRLLAACSKRLPFDVTFFQVQRLLQSAVRDIGGAWDTVEKPRLQQYPVLKGSGSDCIVVCKWLGSLLTDDAMKPQFVDTWLQFYLTNDNV